MKNIISLKLVLIASLIGGLLVALVSTAAASDPVHWGYEGEEGPDHWGELSPDFALCSTGTEQSPVDIPDGAALNSADLMYNYQPSAVNILNNGHTIQVNYDAGSELTLDNTSYKLLQFHFHAHSENTKNGQPAPMEVHFVHQNDAGGLAVVGAWIQSGSENEAFAPVFNNLPATESDPTTVADVTVNADELLPADRSYYRFNGSLTTPPCSEGVKWIMLSEPIELSQAQIDAFTAIFNDNYRPVQPFNDRTFLTTSEVEAQTSEAAVEATTEVTATDTAQTPQEAPETLPQSGGEPFSASGILVGFGLLSLGLGLYLQRRKVARLFQK